MTYRDASKEVFHGLPVEHCPLCGELISIEKIEIVQQEVINCIYCKQSIRAYLPKSEGQLFFTKECNNCDKMNNTRSEYCIYCGYCFSAIGKSRRKQLRQIKAPKFVAYISLAFSVSGIILLIISFTNFNLTMFIVGALSTAIGFLLGLFSRSNPNTKIITIISLILSGTIIAIAMILLSIFNFVCGVF
ncbi:MAG: hypothetical protein KAJ76_07640 [Candidatus Heimdallarchaeota archaeon]|nr:hypothetical protein [Candidatus Heimdallarchaeota archaeon]MCK5182788.1 hypothetical protein [Candidatus Heimdallarchaeota archaeon]MCK5298762.1 hypothetical protein [Candidatus Heimdallarchaeota archaeon]